MPTLLNYQEGDLGKPLAGQKHDLGNRLALEIGEQGKQVALEKNMPGAGNTVAVSMATKSVTRAQSLSAWLSNVEHMDESRSSKPHYISLSEEEVKDMIPTEEVKDMLPSEEVKELGVMEYIRRSRVFTEKNGGHLSSFGNRRVRDCSTATLRRYGDALPFKVSVKKAKNNYTIEGKTLVCCSTIPALWREELYGITRIGVHGIDSMCVVVRKEDVMSLRSRVHQGGGDAGSFRHLSYESWCEFFHRRFMNSVIYEVEELSVARIELDSSTRCIMPTKPFGLVSVNLDKPSGHEASSAEYDVDNVVKFLQEEFSSGATFGFTETVKTGVSALQHLFNKKFTAEEIEVFFLKRIEEKGILDYDSVRTKFSTQLLPPVSRSVNKRLNDFEVEVLPIHAERSIVDYFTPFNDIFLAEHCCPSLFERHET